tara:strand:+ start:9109 stop:9642 length:534 start_codon:yes stop_codon:yes gene_type:complete
MAVTTLTAILIAGTAIAAGEGLNQQRKAAYQGRLQVEEQRKAQKLQVKRQRRAAIRANILATARSRASAEASGTSQSSGLSGAVGAGRSQLGSEFGFGSQLSGLNDNAAEFGLRASEASMKSGVAFQVAGMGMSALMAGVGGKPTGTTGTTGATTAGGSSAPLPKTVPRFAISSSLY